MVHLMEKMMVPKLEHLKDSMSDHLMGKLMVLQLEHVLDSIVGAFVGGAVPRNSISTTSSK